MPTEYFEQRERALLGPRYEQLYAAPQEAAERGVTVSALRAMPEQFAQKADFPLEVSPFCKAAFVVHAPEFKPGRHPYHHAGVFYSQEPSASSAPASRASIMASSASLSSREMSMTPFWLNRKATQPIAPRLPPFLSK